jgi:integrase
MRRQRFVVAGLNVGDVSLTDRIVTVKRSVTKRRQLKAPKNGKARVFAISTQLAILFRHLPSRAEGLNNLNGVASFKHRLLGYQ